MQAFRSSTPQIFGHKSRVHVVGSNYSIDLDIPKPGSPDVVEAIEAALKEKA